VDPYDFRFNIGPHSPLSLPLQRILNRNARALLEVDAEFPPERMHRDVLKQSLKLPFSRLLENKTLQSYLDSVLEEDQTRSVIYSFDAFLGSRARSLSSNMTYPSLEKKVAPLRLLTTGSKISLFLCLQKYTDLIDNELKGDPDLRKQLARNVDNLLFSWIPFVKRLSEAWPEANIVILEAAELAPNWAANVGLITGHPDAHEFEGILDFPTSSISKEGKKALLQKTKSAQPASIYEWRKLVRPYFTVYGQTNFNFEQTKNSYWTTEQIEFSGEKFENEIVELVGMNNVFLANDLIANSQ
jgi:hypothetical protein